MNVTVSPTVITFQSKIVSAGLEMTDELRSVLQLYSLVIIVVACIVYLIRLSLFLEINLTLYLEHCLDEEVPSNEDILVDVISTRQRFIRM